MSLSIDPDATSTTPRTAEAPRDAGRWHRGGRSVFRGEKARL